MSHIINVEWLEDAKDDFDSFIAERNWVSAQAIIDNLWEQGFNHEAELLRRAFLRAQYLSVSLRKIRVQDLNEQVECDTCWETPGQVECEIEQDHIHFEECSDCNGTGMVDVPVNIIRWDENGIKAKVLGV